MGTEPVEALDYLGAAVSVVQNHYAPAHVMIVVASETDHKCRVRASEGTPPIILLAGANMMARLAQAMHGLDAPSPPETPATLDEQGLPGT